jgi:hypothetical protein
MKEIENFMYYMFNKWSFAEAKKIFGESLGEHIFGKWTERYDNLQWFGDLDKECRKKIIDRANEIYNN